MFVFFLFLRAVGFGRSALFGRTKYDKENNGKYQEDVRRNLSYR